MCAPPNNSFFHFRKPRKGHPVPHHGAKGDYDNMRGTVTYHARGLGMQFRTRLRA